MGFVTQYFIRPFKRPLVQAPAGTFLVDADGKIFSSTLPPTFPQENLTFIGKKILAVFTGAAKAGVPLRELFISYEQFKFQAKHLPSGALIHLIPPADIDG
jgi:hypothetical protein